MEFLQINKLDTHRWNKVWRLYEDSFPAAERRKEEDQLRACADERFFPLSAWNGRELVGLLFYWEWDSYRYLEHLAVNPELRGQSYGSQLLRHLQDSEHTIILEIDPLVNELSVRRLQFYEKVGFTLTPYRFLHLAYRLEAEPVELLILSYPRMITRAEREDFLRFLSEVVAKYCEADPAIATNSAD